MPFYKAFGISFESEISVPQFTESEDCQADVSIKFDKVQQYLLPEDKVARAALLNEREVCFYWKQIGWFLVRDGREILIEADSEADEKLITLPLVGVVLATLLHQRGLLVLHASAVSINNHGAAFVGQKGKGKSTTAAMLYQRGHPVITDDILAIGFTKDKLPFVVPGFPNFKLLPDTISALGDDPNVFSECYEGAEKRYRTFLNNFLRENIPLKSVFYLKEGIDLQINQFQPQEALTVLIGNTYLARYGKELFSKEQVLANLRHCSFIVNQIPVYQLERPKSFPMMEDLAELIESKFSAAASKDK